MPNPHCQRCYVETDKLYTITYEVENDYGDPQPQAIKVCWSCDHDIINGGDIDEDESEIYERRKQNAYDYDTINNEMPY